MPPRDSAAVPRRDAPAQTSGSDQEPVVLTSVGASTAAPRELTLRALAAGVIIGGVLAAGNVYIGLKAAFMDGMAIPAVLLSFTFFALFRGLTRSAFGVLETNIVQTTAASAAISSFTLGLNGPVPAAYMMGNVYSWWVVLVWGLGLGMLGVFLAALLRRKLIDEEQLPFPTGNATAEVIEAIHANKSSAFHRTKLLLIALAACGAVTWMRDGSWALLPQAVYLPLVIGGVAASTLTLGVSFQPLMAAIGIFMGVRGTVSLLAGGVLAWGVLAPWLVRAHLVKEVSYGALVGWMIWPSVGLLTSSTVASVVLDWKPMLRGIKDLLGLGAGRRGRVSSSAVLRRSALVVMLACGGGTLLVGWRVLHIPPVVLALAFATSVVLSGICARAAGETDIGPAGPLATLSELLFSGSGAGVAVLAGSVVNGQAAQTTQALWTLKTGKRVGGSPHAQLLAQMLGVVAGGLVAVPVYYLLLHAYGVGTQHLPAPAALSWRATALGVQGGLSSFPPGALAGVGVGLVVGAVFTALGRLPVARYLPSITAVAIGFITPASLSAAAMLGVVGVAIARRLRPGVSDGSINALAAGGLAGESLMGVVVAALMAAGLMH